MVLDMLLIVVAGQIWFVNVLFRDYLVENDFENIEPTVFVAYFTAVVVEVIGLVLVITKSLFPGREKDSPASA